jgi:hypothetical protein
MDNGMDLEVCCRSSLGRELLVFSDSRDEVGNEGAAAGRLQTDVHEWRRRGK